jgi:hypothetical protein
VHGSWVDEPWVQYNGASVGQTQRIYLHTDHQHIAHSDGLGNSVNALRYDVYGLADIGLYYYKARMYSPVLGRFMKEEKCQVFNLE